MRISNATRPKRVRLALVLVSLLAPVAASAQGAPSPTPTPDAPRDSKPKPGDPPSPGSNNTGVGAEAGPPPYSILRQDEDWSYLRDESRRSDFFDPIKYVRLRRGRDDWFLTLGGEVRPYYENFRAEQWGEVPEDGDGFWLQRYMFHADFHLGKKARAFVQLKSGIELGRPTGPRPPDEDKLDVNQLFFDYTFSFGAGRQGAASASGGASAGGGGAGSSLTVRLGRQELNYGSGRLVSAREGPNVRSSFDGAKLIFRSGDWRADAFAARPVTTERGYFDDRANSRLAFWGVYVVRRLPRMPGASVDLYYLGLDRKAARFEQGAGRDRRHSAGARLWNRGRAFDYDLEGVYQFGSFGEGRPSRGIRAWTVSTTTGYTFRRTRFAPRASLYTGIASGDKDPNDGLLQTFHPVFPRGAYFGQIGANGALNVRGFRPLLTLQVLKDVSVGAGSYFFWRDSRRDGLYAVPGVLLRRSGASRARFVGSQPEVEVVWKVDRHTTLSLNYARFFVGRFLEETGPSENTRYFAAWVTYKF